MEDAYQLVEIAIFLALGAALGAGFAFLAYAGKLGWRRILALGLAALAVLYLPLAFRSDNISGWLAVEMTGVAIYGSIALFSFMGSPWFLVAGFLARPLWAIQFHYIGTGSAFTPEWIPLVETGFDLVLAAFAGFMATRRAAPAPVAQPARSERTQRLSKPKPERRRKDRAR